jgi:hypothetical protein
MCLVGWKIHGSPKSAYIEAQSFSIQLIENWKNALSIVQLFLFMFSKHFVPAFCFGENVK